MDMCGGEDRRIEIPTMLILIPKSTARETGPRPGIPEQVLIPGIRGPPGLC